MAARRGHGGRRRRRAVSRARGASGSIGLKFTPKSTQDSEVSVEGKELARARSTHATPETPKLTTTHPPNLVRPPSESSAAPWIVRLIRRAPPPPPRRGEDHRTPHRVVLLSVAPLRLGGLELHVLAAAEHEVVVRAVRRRDASPVLDASLSTARASASAASRRRSASARARRRPCRSAPAGNPGAASGSKGASSPTRR